MRLSIEARQRREPASERETEGGSGTGRETREGEKGDDKTPLLALLEAQSEQRSNTDQRD